MTLHAVSLAGRAARKPGQRNLFCQWQISGEEETVPEEQMQEVFKMLKCPEGGGVGRYVKDLTLNQQNGLKLPTILGLVENMKNMERLELSRCTVWTDGVLCEQQSDKLRVLDLRSITVPAGEDTVMVEELLKLSEGWKSVSLKDICFLEDRELILSGLKTEALTISYSAGLQDGDNRLHIAGCDNMKLSYLAVEYAKTEDVGSLAALVKGSLTTLKTISLGCGLTSSELSNVAGMQMIIILWCRTDGMLQGNCSSGELSSMCYEAATR